MKKITNGDIFLSLKIFIIYLHSCFPLPCFFIYLPVFLKILFVFRQSVDDYASNHLPFWPYHSVDIGYNNYSLQPTFNFPSSKLIRSKYVRQQI